MADITREEAFSILKEYNKDPFHIQRSTGASWDCFMMWILNCTRRNTA